MLENCCAFIVHRPRKFPWKYDEADSRCAALKTMLSEQIAAMAAICNGERRSGDHALCAEDGQGDCGDSPHYTADLPW